MYSNNISNIVIFNSPVDLIPFILDNIQPIYKILLTLFM